MAKKKLSATGLIMKKLARLANVTFATKEEVDALENGADISTLFAMRVDPQTMHLMATTTAAGSTFSVSNGHLILEQQ